MLKKRLFVLLFLSVSFITAHGANLLTNSKFTTGDLTGWTVELVSAPGDVNAFVQTDVTYDGSPCLFMRSRTNLWDGAAVGQVVDVNGLATVDFSCVANKPASGNWGDVRVDLNWYNGPYDPCDPNINYLSWEEWDIVVDGSGTTDWDAFAHTFTVPTGAVNVIFRIRANDWIWNVWIDDVFFGTSVCDQATLVTPAPGSSVPKEDKSNCGYGPTLQWTAAPCGTGNHHVYFGTSYDDVNDANASDPEYLGSVPLATTSYTLDLNDVDKGTAYFWRVDETTAGGVVKAESIWQFSVSNITWVDRFDNYPGNTEIQAVWGANATVSNWTMQINYNSTNYEVSANTSNLLCSTDISENAILVLLIKGHDNMSDNVYVKLESNSGAQSGIVHFPDSRELNQQNYEPFITWPINLQDFVSHGIDLTNVTGIKIGVGTGSGGPAGSGTVSFDDIRLDYPYCIAELIPADFDNNCWVGMEELVILTDNWLASSYVVTASAPSQGPILWYKCDEGSGNDPLDSSGNSYDGFISDLGAWGGPGTGYDGTDCINLGNTAWIEIPIEVNNDQNTIGAESTVSFWMNDPGQTEDADDGSMMLQIGADGQVLNLWSGSTGSFSFKAGWDSGLGYGDTLDIGDADYTNPDHPQDEWVHYAFVKSISNNYVRAYRNGKLIAQIPAAAAETPLIDGVDSFASIGAWRWSGGTGGYYDGLIDDFRIYDYALSDSEVLYLAVQGGTATSPMIQGLLTSSDANGDNVVEFSDFALMAQFWLEQVVWP